MLQHYENKRWFSSLLFSVRRGLGWGRLVAYLSLSFLLIFCGIKLNSGEAPIKWVDDLGGDFSFKENWSYPEGVYRNEFGQLSCDGLCPPEADRMKDENGKIYEDSLKAFYQLVDTTHLFHSIQSEAQTYEWGGTDYITAKRINSNTVVCFTQDNVATHSSLYLIISKKTVTPTIILNSIMDFGTKTYSCKSGQMIIDKKFWNEGIVKAIFDFRFYNDEHSDKLYWKGKIYTKISN